MAPPGTSKRMCGGIATGGPGVKLPEKTGNITADLFFIEGEFFQARGRCPEHFKTGPLPVAADGAAQLPGYLKT